jgi:hypothetical protein
MLSPLTRAIGCLLACVAAALVTAPLARATADLSAYQGPGTWVDIFDSKLRANPEPAVARMAGLGIRTVYVETANYRTPRREKMAYRSQTARLIEAAHADGMRVVGWYLPGLRKLSRDLRRSLGAIGFTTPAGERFDAFALDIEASAVRSIKRRNRAAERLSLRIRRSVGPEYPLGAIVPDNRSTSSLLPSLWPAFPYARLRPYYDVFLPMAYSTGRGEGARFVYRYTLDNLDYLRTATGDPGLPVHAIGGLAHGLGSSEAKAVVRAALGGGAIGASFYEYVGSGKAEWRALQSLP